MSIFRYIFDNDYMQRADIENLRARQAQQNRFQRLRQSRENMKLETMADELGELALFCRTTLAILMDKGIITQQEFVAKMEQVDMADGVKDGKYEKPKVKRKA